jgi:hypothetical protein
VLGREALDPIERFAPGGFGLAGKAGDQVDIDVADAGGAEMGDFGGDDLRIVAAAATPNLGVNEGLNAE